MQVRRELLADPQRDLAARHEQVDRAVVRAVLVLHQPLLDLREEREDGEPVERAARLVPVVLDLLDDARDVGDVRAHRVLVRVRVRVRVRASARVS